MKKFLAIVIALVLMCLTLTACGTPKTDLVGDGAPKTVEEFLDGNTYAIDVKGISLADNTPEQEYVSIILDSTIGNQINITGDTNIVDTLTVTRDAITHKITIAGDSQYKYTMTTQLVITIGASVNDLNLSGNFGIETPNFNAVDGFKLGVAIGGVAGYINFGSIENVELKFSLAFSELTLIGTCTNLSSIAAGQVKLHAYDLSVTNATISSFPGDSLYEVDVTGTLSFTTDDAVCTYEGEPTITQDIKGTGSVAAKAVEP